MKYLLALLIISLFSITTYSQDAPAPDYLTRQHFPDSVKALTMQTLDGKKITFGQMLEMYKGKKVLVDIWASWCRDCIAAQPKLEALRRQIGEEHVAYVFLSIDKDESKWKAGITKYNMFGHHYLVSGAWDNPLANYIALDWVPRYFVLDENGKVIMPKAVIADDAKLSEVLR